MYQYGHTTRSTRQTSLLNKLELLDRFYSKEKDINFYIDNKINYKNVNININKYKSEAIQYLKNSMENNNE